jgi:hypothetical protein
LFLIAILTLGLIYFMWWRTSFTRALSDGEIVERLAVDIAPHDIQHALEQLYGRLGPNYEGRELFRAPLLGLVEHERFEIRRQVAWVLGRDKVDDYRLALTKLLEDRDLGVQMNAACALTNHGSALGKPILLKALGPWELKAKSAGKLHWQIKRNDAVSLGRPAGTIELEDGTKVAITVALNGFADEIVSQEGANVLVDQVLARISADPKNVTNVLIALRIVGTADDSPAIEALLNGSDTRLLASREVVSSAESLLKLLRSR